MASLKIRADGAMTYFDEAAAADSLEALVRSDAMLMGRGTYEYLGSTFPTLAGPCAERVHTIRKYVFSSSLKQAEWNNSTVISDDVVAAVSELKQQDGGDLMIYGPGVHARASGVALTTLMGRELGKGSASSAAERPPIRVGALAPLSSPGFLEAGRHFRAGIELAVQETNAAGGIGGRPLELVLCDTAGNPEGAAAAVRDFSAGGVVAVVGEYHSVVARAAAAAAVEARLPFVVHQRSSTLWWFAPAQSYCWRIYADYLASAGHDHVALVVQPDRYWSSGAQLLQASLADRGVTVSRIDVAGLSNAAVVDAVTATVDADALLLLVAYPEPAAWLVEAVRADTRTAALRVGDPAGRAECREWATLLGHDGAWCPLPALPARPARAARNTRHCAADTKPR